MEKLFYKLDSFLREQISRRKFLKICLGWFAYFVAENKYLKLAFAKAKESEGRVKKGVKGDFDLVVAKDTDPYANTVKAIAAMGGMERFVKKGDIVVVKPNMAWDRTPEQAANTDPNVIAALVDLCYKAGAKRVNVFDVPCNDDRRAYENSGIKKAAEDKGAFVYFADHWNVVKAKFPYKSSMEDWPVLRDAVKCDTFINVPVLKHHRLATLTISMKNLMGVCSGRRGVMHVGLSKNLVDLTSYINPDLTIVDATRVLLRNGPSGGNLEDVKTLNKIVVATDPTLADAYACTLVDKKPEDVGSIREAVKRGLGNADISKAKIHTV